MGICSTHETLRACTRAFGVTYVLPGGSLLHCARGPLAHGVCSAAAIMALYSLELFLIPIGKVLRPRWSSRHRVCVCWALVFDAVMVSRVGMYPCPSLQREARPRTPPLMISDYSVSYSSIWVVVCDRMFVLRARSVACVSSCLSPLLYDYLSATL